MTQKPVVRVSWKEARASWLKRTVEELTEATKRLNERTMTQKKPVGWRNKWPDDPERHALSARGIENARPMPIPMKRTGSLDAEFWVDNAIVMGPDEAERLERIIKNARIDIGDILVEIDSRPSDPDLKQLRKFVQSLETAEAAKKADERMEHIQQAHELKKEIDQRWNNFQLLPKSELLVILTGVVGVHSADMKTPKQDVIAAIIEGEYGPTKMKLAFGDE